MAIFFLQMFLMVSYFESNSLVSPVFQISQTWDPIGHCCCTFYVYVAGASPLELVERVELCLPFDDLQLPILLFSNRTFQRLFG